MVWLHQYAHVRGRGKMPRLDDIWRPAWGYGPMLGAALGLAVLLLAYWQKSNGFFLLGIVLQMLAWIGLLLAGVKAVRGPHRKPE